MKKETFMSKMAKKKPVPRKGDVPASKGRHGRDKKMKEKLSDSDDIERAVYDGMQDLRVKRSK